MELKDITSVVNGISKESEKINPEDTEEDQILSVIGDCGKWQNLIILLIALCCVPACWHLLIMTFMNAEVDNWCSRPDSVSNMSVSNWKNISGQTEDSCTILDRDWENLIDMTDNVSSVVCNSWQFDDSDFTSTITSEFELVCGQEYLKATAQTMYFVGSLFGVITFGVLADKFGRKKVLITLLISQAATGILTSQMPSFSTFVFARLLNAFSVTCIFEVQYSYILELVGGKWSTIWGVGVDFFWPLGWLLLAALAYFVRDWRHLMMATSIPPAIGGVLIWFIPESSRWLLATGKIEEAEKVIKRIAKFNKITLPQGWKLKPMKEKDDNEKGKANLLCLFKANNLRNKTLILYIQWFVTNFAYYGLTMNIGSLTLNSNIYLNFTISGLLEIPADCLALIILQFCGRRVPYFTSMLLCGISLLSISIIPSRFVMAAALIGKTCIGFSWTVLFLYSAELFPTEIRTTGIGSASFIGRFGGILAAWIELLGTRNHLPHLTVLVFGMSAVIAGLIAVMLPETAGRDLPYTVEETEKLPLAELPWSSHKNGK